MNQRDLSMPLVLTVLHGQASGDLTLTPTRGTAMLGRSPACDIVLDDIYVNDSHAAIYFDASGPRIRDLGSKTGTWVNGVGVQSFEAPLATGDRVQVGQTMFSVEVMAEDAPPRETGDEEALASTFQTTPHDCARFALRAEGAPLFALVDVARDPELLEMLNESGEEFSALDETADPGALGEAAPFLVAFSRGSLFLGQMLEGAWGNDQAVFFTSDAPFRDVYAHCLGLIEQDEARAFVGPRLWLPEVLGERLAGVEGDEARALFGPVKTFLIESDDEGVMLRWFMQGDAVESERVELRV